MGNTSSHYLFLSILAAAFHCVLLPGCVTWPSQSMTPKATSPASMAVTKSIIQPLNYPIDITMYRKASNSLVAHDLLVISRTRSFIARPGYYARRMPFLGIREMAYSLLFSCTIRLEPLEPAFLQVSRSTQIIFGVIQLVNRHLTSAMAATDVDLVE